VLLDHRAETGADEKIATTIGTLHTGNVPAQTSSDRRNPQ
jgi:hypothetical protein